MNKLLIVEDQKLLGLAFSAAAMGPRHAEGVFVGEHGSRNRRRPAAYKVVFVPFRNGRPAGSPVDFGGCQDKSGRPHGRPAGVTADLPGALTADALSNTSRRVTRVR